MLYLVRHIAGAGLNRTIQWGPLHLVSAIAFPAGEAFLHLLSVALIVEIDIAPGFDDVFNMLVDSGYYVVFVGCETTTGTLAILLFGLIFGRTPCCAAARETMIKAQQSCQLLDLYIQLAASVEPAPLRACQLGDR